MANEKDASGQAAEGTSRRAGEAASTIAKASAATLKENAAEAGSIAEEQSRRLGQLFGLQAQISERAVNRSTQTIDTMMQCGSVLADGWQSIFREWVNYTQSAIQRNAEGVGEMMRSRSLDDFVENRDRLLREEMELLMNSSVRISELSAKHLHDAARHLKAAADPKRASR